MGFYDDIRILQHLEDLQRIEAGRATDCAPIHVRIEPSEVCNFRCCFCWWHNKEKRKTLPSFDFTGKRLLDEARLLSLIDELAEMGTRAISFTGAGDPLMHPGMVRVLARITEHGLVFGVTSNMAMPMSADLIRELVRARWLRWSMNAGSMETYLKVSNPRGVDPARVYMRVQENVRLINEARKGLAVRPDFNASYVVTAINESDILPAARLAAKLGVDSISFRPDTPLSRQMEPNKYNEDVVRDAYRAEKELQNERFKVYLNPVRQEDTQKYGDPELFCFYSNHTTYVDARGNVYPCCYTRYHSDYVIGNIMQRSFNDFWFGSYRRESYRKLLHDACPACCYGRMNKALKPLYKGESSAVDVVVPVQERDDFI